MTSTSDDRRPPTRDHSQELTDREREVLALLGQGASNPEIGARLVLGANAVKTHLRMAYRKIGATRRPQAILWAHRHGLVDQS